MSRKMVIGCAWAVVVLGVPGIAASRSGRAPIRSIPARDVKPQVGARTKSPAPASAPAAPKMTLEEARAAVALLNDAYQAVLEETHETYPTKPGRPVAATVVRELQKIMAARGWPASRFLGVNAILMNPDHAPRDAFEKDAAASFRLADRWMERTEGNRYRAAAVVSLGGGCASCHWTDSGTSARAAITWNIPVRATD